MKNVFWMVAIFLAAVALAFVARANTGSVIFLLAQQRIEISVNLKLELMIYEEGDK